MNIKERVDKAIERIGALSKEEFQEELYPTEDRVEWNFDIVASTSPVLKPATIQSYSSVSLEVNSIQFRTGVEQENVHTQVNNRDGESLAA